MGACGELRGRWRRWAAWARGAGTGGGEGGRRGERRFRRWLPAWARVAGGWGRPDRWGPPIGAREREGGREDFEEGKGGAGRPSKEGAREGGWADGPTKKKKGKKTEKGKGFPGDVSNIRQVPDHQEVFVDPARDESLIFDLLDLKGEVEDGSSALWFLRDIANEQNAGDNLVVEHSGTIELSGLQFGDAPTVAGTVVGQLAISKGRQGREAQNIVRESAYPFLY
uniref:Uncharacterized protein n=1 Tax=Oryza meridionalis TaxID=40149 RepID=A0A0E0D2R2_9ORYZ